MDGISLELQLFIVATFAAALVAGLSGFAFGLVAASIWLYILTPLQSASLIIAFGLIVQGYSVWKLRGALDWGRLWPFILGAAVDAVVGFLNGALGGITGLAGILVTIWCGLRGWPKDVQRAVFQPVAVATFVVSALWIGAKGALSADTVRLFLTGLPALFAGTWLGLKLFGRLDEAAFRKIVLLLLLASGAVLIV
ncbi:permease [Bradyrhizobium centrolobii]|uniref:Probable membrane transporter protein n=1 Tax=Bradyrhizobium centrolobii TaxID=1505087 RepID=A0A176YFB8_9BRAD|nr:TSUP family transporter [Bradyrhizobium centrolobii]OAF05300.1 permease [Bradyrhizobium centrolobii]